MGWSGASWRPPSPARGGRSTIYDAVYGRTRVGRLLKFLFVWQFLVSGPLELASGALGLALYAGVLVPGLGRTSWAWGVTRGQLLAAALMLAITALAYRRIEVAGRL